MFHACARTTKKKERYLERDPVDFFVDQRVEIRDSDNKIQGMISRKENSEQTTKKRSEIRREDQRKTEW